MFYKYFFYILLILAVVLTIGLCISKPPMHTALLVYDSEQEIVKTENVSTKTKINSVKSIPVPQQSKTAQVKTVKTVSQSQNKVQPVSSKKVVTTSPKTVKTIAPKQTKVQSQTSKTKSTVQPQTQKTVTVKQEPQKTKTAVVTKKTQPPVQQVKTTAQEEIEWNRWRSNIQNQIMRDVKLPILPQGTVFKFSFDVDKYGRVTNVQSWSTTPAYTPYAIQQISPVIRSYQGRAILEFPSGSNRITTTVTGQWKISNSQKYSTSANFHDIETVKKEY